MQNDAPSPIPPATEMLPLMHDARLQLEAVLAHVPVIVFAIDDAGTLTLIEGNDTNDSLIPKAAIIGQSVFELLKYASFPNLETELRRVLGGEARDITLHLGDYTYEVRTSPLFGEGGRVLGAIGVSFDNTNAHRIEAALRQSEARYRSIIETIEDGYYEVNLRGDLTFINDALTRVLQYPKELILDTELNAYRRFTDSPTADKLRDAFHRVYETGEAVRAFETTILLPNGERRCIEISIALIRKDEGTPSGFRGIVRDVTERQSIQDTLARRMTQMAIIQQMDAELNQTLDLDNVLVIALNAATILSHADTGFIGLIEPAGYSPETADGLRVAQAIKQQQEGSLLPIDVGIVGRVLRNGSAELVLDVLTDPDYFSDVPSTRAEIAIPLISHDRVFGVLNLETSEVSRFTQETFDYTHMLGRRIATAIENARLYMTSQTQLGELRTLYTQVSALEQLKTDMIRVASHDLRSPLGIITGYLDILEFDLAGMLSEEQRGYLEAMKRAADRIGRMSTEILSLERVQTSRTQPQAVLPLDGLAHKAVIDYRDAALMKGVDLHHSLPAEPVLVKGDATSLTEAIGNLIGNAIKYTPAGGRIDLAVNIGESDEAPIARFEVRDTGIGIKAEDQAQLFQPFYRVKSEGTQHIDGTGLGLYLVKRIVEQHHGQMRFSSRYGEGSTFGFELPLVSPPTRTEPEMTGQATDAMTDTDEHQPAPNDDTQPVHFSAQQTQESRRVSLNGTSEPRQA